MLLPRARARLLRTLALPRRWTRPPRRSAARLAYLCQVGLGYLTLDRQSRTLSGGEVQRINLTTALGTSLVNTLFVLDEPSIGLHPRDMGRVIDVMKRLRDAGNSLVVVEHDPQIMLEADKLLDMGPGPGERGGEIVFFGPPDELKRAGTLTAEYLSGRKRADARRPSEELRIPGMQVPNDLATDPLIGTVASASAAPPSTTSRTSTSISRCSRLVCVTGVSGSGKSTLVQDVLHPALLKHLGKPTETPGAFARAGGRGARERRGVRRPVADRAHHALQPGELRGRLRRDPRALRQRRRTSKARGYTARHLQLQLRQRPLPHLQRQRLRARRDAVPLRRVPALPGLRRHALPRRGARGAGGRPQHRRRARAHRRARRSPFFAGNPEIAAPPARRWSTWASTTCASASRCRRSPAARRSA